MVKIFLKKPASKNLSDAETSGVKTLLGDPKKAIIKLAIPMIFAMFIQTMYNFVDALWVSGFGQNIFTSAQVADTGMLALAAIGFVLPFYMIILALSNGIGIGGGSAISRKIGAGDKQGADNVAIHLIILSIIISIVFTVVFLLFLDKIFVLMGAGEANALAITYGRIIFAGSMILFFTNTAYAILRGEGDAKRAMYAIVIGAVANIILDPIFIYSFGLGIAGAAYATILSLALTSVILIYWLFFKKNTYVSFGFRNFKFNKKILKDIFDVGLPASFQQISMSVTMILINYIIINFAQAGDSGVAVYSTGWRVVQMAVLPMLGLATAIISVTGAAYGAREFKKLDDAFMFSVKFGLIIEIVIAALTFVFAPALTALFTTGEGSAGIVSNLKVFLQIVCLFYPGAALGIAASSMFQGVGKGLYSLIATLLRTVILTPILAVVFCCLLNAGLVGIWWGLVVSNLVGSAVAFIWSKVYINGLFKEKKIEKIVTS